MSAALPQIKRESWVVAGQVAGLAALFIGAELLPGLRPLLVTEGAQQGAVTVALNIGQILLLCTGVMCGCAVLERSLRHTQTVSAALRATRHGLSRPE